MLRIKLDDVQSLNNLNGAELESYVVFLIANNLLGDEIPEIGKVTNTDTIDDNFVKDFIGAIIDTLFDLSTSGFINDSSIEENINQAIVKLDEFSTYETRQRVIPAIVEYLSDSDALYVY